MFTKHFILSEESIQEIQVEEAIAVATGLRLLPDLAGTQRYFQVNVLESGEQLKVSVSGAFVVFDEEGRLKNLNAPPPKVSRGKGKKKIEMDLLSPFEHETCVQWALQGTQWSKTTMH